MPRSARIGIIGDHAPRNPTHVGTDEAFRHAGDILGIDLVADWVPTTRLVDSAPRELAPYNGLLVATGSPYRSMEGALNAVRWAREGDVPLLGTCGGFQHMIVEFARDALGVTDADHAEVHPRADHLYVTPLACSLVGKTEPVTILPGTRAFQIYGRGQSDERFYCNFGLNHDHRREIEDGGFRTSGLDRNGEVRIMEVPRNRFFFGTLFVPQMSSTKEHPHPMVLSLVQSATE
ncbi:MAG TPA: CTP synthase [Thermoplasmata archaeon]|nr:CTP synthase [Thermoplasmata archaeon]